MIFVFLILALAVVLLGMSIKQLKKITEDRLANLALRTKTLEEEPNKEMAELRASGRTKTAKVSSGAKKWGCILTFSVCERIAVKQTKNTRL